MSSDNLIWIRVAAASALSALFAACGGLSDAGQQANLSPTAVAHVVGYDGPDPDGNVTIDVRAQSELALTGKESIDADKPIISFEWTPANEAAEGAKLTVRNSSTVTVSVPRVAAVTNMQFTLAVEDSDGDTDTATVTLTVHPVPDSNRFLQYADNQAKIRVVAGTSDELATAAEFTVELRACVTYRARSGEIMSVSYEVGSPITGEWPQQAGGDSGPTDPNNVPVEFDIPGIDLDAITRMFLGPIPDDAMDCDSAPIQRAVTSVADPAYVDDATLALGIILTPPPLLQTATLYLLDPVKSANNGGSGGPVELRLIVDESLEIDEVNELRIAGDGRVENEDTARSYYDAIDPPPYKKDTLQKWLVENCFDPSAADYGADAHAVYVNNFDLGFGRDMYLTKCAGKTASVVVNYLTLEAAVKKIDPIIAVAMEYTPDADSSTPGLVTFFAFAPELGSPTGDFRRVRTVNFDGRGEKFVPGVCTACHGGGPKEPNRVEGPLLTYSASSKSGKDVGATFMPWDLESFLYSDTDPVFPCFDPALPCSGSDASLRGQFTRGAQETAFKDLNIAAYETYGSGSVENLDFACHANFGGPPNFGGPCDLVNLWYDDLADVNSHFENGRIAFGWQNVGVNDPDGGDADMDGRNDAEELYTDIFARNCRACHVQQVVGGFNQFESYAFFKLLSPLIRPQVVGGDMPGARLTMDRLWRPGPDGTSKGDRLIAHPALNPPPP